MTTDTFSDLSPATQNLLVELSREVSYCDRRASAAFRRGDDADEAHWLRAQRAAEDRFRTANTRAFAQLSR